MCLIGIKPSKKVSNNGLCLGGQNVMTFVFLMLISMPILTKAIKDIDIILKALQFITFQASLDLKT